jgi:hypothetical protein
VPHKEAVLLAIATNTAPFEAQLQVYEITRKKGKVTDLVVFGEPTTDTGLLALAFLAGWHSRSLSDDDVQQRQPGGMRAFW